MRLPFNGSFPVTQGFGPSALTGEPAYNGYAHFHKGVDYGLPCGTVVVAPFAGTAASHSDPNGFGNYVTITSGDKVAYLAHLSEIDATGSVSEGQRIGLSGTTGYSTGCHLHYELHVNGIAVDSRTQSGETPMTAAELADYNAKVQEITGLKVAVKNKDDEITNLKAQVSQLQATGSNDTLVKLRDALKAILQ